MKKYSSEWWYAYHHTMNKKNNDTPKQYNPTDKPKISDVIKGGICLLIILLMLVFFFSCLFWPNPYL